MVLHVHLLIPLCILRILFVAFLSAMYIKLIIIRNYHRYLPSRKKNSILCNVFLVIPCYFSKLTVLFSLQDISKQGDLILMSQFLIHGENGVKFMLSKLYL